MHRLKSLKDAYWDDVKKHKKLSPELEALVSGMAALCTIFQVCVLCVKWFFFPFASLSYLYDALIRKFSKIAAPAIVAERKRGDHGHGQLVACSEVGRHPEDVGGGLRWMLSAQHIYMHTHIHTHTFMYLQQTCSYA